ncbi:MAG TPA: hypothetical protein VF646_18280 [Cytophagales bacterium]
MTSVCLQFETPFPALRPGDTLRAEEVTGLEHFSPLLEIVHAQEHGATLMRGQMQHQCLVFTRAYHPQGEEIPVQELSRLTNRQMMGDL